jgi:dCTP diphosphatase
MNELTEIRDRMRAFTRVRDWERFHDPKSLILAITGEVGELAELFQWLPAERAKTLASTGKLHGRVGEEIADILIYLVRLADVLEIDLADATFAKLEAISRKFPAAEYQGLAPVKD